MVPKFLSVLCVAAAAGLIVFGFTTGLAERAVDQFVPTEPAPVVREPIPIAALNFDAAVADAGGLPRLRSLLVSVDGQLVVERYFGGATAARTANIKSVSKSIIATLVGIAIDRGDIPSVHEPIGRYFPQYLADDPARAAITSPDIPPLCRVRPAEAKSAGPILEFVIRDHANARASLTPGAPLD